MSQHLTSLIITLLPFRAKLLEICLFYLGDYLSFHSLLPLIQTGPYFSLRLALVKVTHTAASLSLMVSSHHLTSLTPSFWFPGHHIFFGFPPTSLAAFLVSFAGSFSYPQPLNLEVFQGLSLILFSFLIYSLS